ncbi:unnamed protein product [Brachionus calyciflorus]|uniref:Reverse transcriptase domain-containing protein n=1 Tax=Brachionus calyciflorus TaxID=104777 RepID=A0A813VJ82_9BILA|nr:unnamed protein product [Brachionus calyciflorus]
MKIAYRDDKREFFVEEDNDPMPFFGARTDIICDPEIENLSCGPDNIHNKVLIGVADAIAVPITLIFQKSYGSGEIPQVWKRANVSPLFKSGSRINVENYRPVSLTCVLCKVLASIIKDSMLKHLLDNELISDAQHGFLLSKSCTTNLLETIDVITFALAEGFPVDAIYTDFSKAFDKIPHRRLMYKISKFGFGVKLINWIKAFLRDRIQRVVLGDSYSDWLSVLSGVPQGSVLGPILFLLYINDLFELIQNTFKASADDTKIISVIRNFLSNLELQCDIDFICKWCKDWSTQLNIPYSLVFFPDIITKNSILCNAIFSGLYPLFCNKSSRHRTCF